MGLLITGKLGKEVLEPNEAESQPRGRKPHTTQGKDDGVESGTDRKYQYERDGRRNEERP